MKHFTLIVLVLSMYGFTLNAQITTYPYTEDFEAGPGGWSTTGTLWALGTPSGTVINSASSGVNSWATGLSTSYPNSANEVITSPVFDFTAIPAPAISINIWWNNEFSWDGAVLQSSIDGGATWQNVGAFGDPNNWYTDNTIGGNPGGQQSGWSGRNSTANGSGTWVFASHALTGLGGQSNVIFRFAFGSDTSGIDDGFAFDDVTIYNVTCSQPTALTATGITDISANLGWTEAGTASSWNVEWGPSGFTLGSGTLVNGVTNPHPLAGLAPSTAYSYYVQADCGGSTSAWSGPYSFTTNCSSFMAPWMDDLESNPGVTGSWTLSECWTQTTPSSASLFDWNITTTGTTGSTGTGANSAHSGTHYFYTEASYGTSGVSTTVIESPMIDVTGLGTDPMLEFWYHMAGAQIGTLTTEVWNGTVWNQVDVMTGAQQANQADDWLKKTIYLAGYTGTIQVRLTAVSGGTFEGDICIDDISVIEIPSCPAPTDIFLVSADVNSATVGWTLSPLGVETEWELEYGPQGFTPGGGLIMGTMNNPETILGLTPNSFYDVYVQSVCGVGDSSTLIGPITVNTYNQGQYMVSDADCPVAGFIDISATGTDLSLTDDSEAGIDPLPFSVLFQGILYTNVTVGNNGGVQLGTTTGAIGYGGNFTTMANGTMFPWGDDLDDETGNVYVEVIGTAPNQTMIVQWDNICNFSGSPTAPTVTFQIQIDEATGEIWYVYDDVVFGGTNVADDYGSNADIGLSGPNQDITISTNNPTYLQNNSCVHFYYTDCPDPVNYNVTYTTFDEGAITWSAGMANETNWTVIYGPEGFDPTMTGTTVQTTSTSLIISGLDDATVYDVYIYSDCDPGVIQSEGAFGQFTTLPNCADVTGLAGTTLVDSIFTTWNFTANPGFPVTDFGMEYGLSGFANGTGTYVWGLNTAANADTLADPSLIGGALYDVYVQSVCGTDSSYWVGPITVTMPLTNDAVCFPEMLAVDGTVYTLNGAGATVAAGEPAIAPAAGSCTGNMTWCNSTMNFTTWFTFIAPASGNVRIDGESAGFDGQIAVYETSNCSNFAQFTLVGANDDSPQGGNAPFLNVCGLTAGTTYYLVHDPKSTTTTGIYSLRIQDVPVEAGTDNGVYNACIGEVVDLSTLLTGADAGGTWYESIATAGFNDPLFSTAGLASQVFDFEYQVIDGCAADSVSVSVEVFSPSSAGADGSLTICLNQQIDLLSALNGNIDLGGTWYDESNNPLPNSTINGGTLTAQFNYYYITGNGVCPDDTSNVTINVDGTCDILTIAEFELGELEVYPNPTQHVINISNTGSNEVFSYSLTDLNGKVISSSEAAINGEKTTVINVENLERGVYFIHVFNENAEKTFRIVKQ